jgi:glycerol-3-phosphate acyltransferase PlsY
VGSKNLGATNVYRTLGPPLGILTLVLDILKGALPVWLLPNQAFAQTFPGGHEWCAVVAGLAAVAGHVFTLFAGFKGGKGVATTAGVLIALSPQAFGVFAGVFLVTLLATRYVSLGSILGSLAFTIALGFWSPAGLRSPVFGVGALLALLVIVRHKDNISRLLRGEERRFAFTRGKS